MDVSRESDEIDKMIKSPEKRQEYVNKVLKSSEKKVVVNDHIDQSKYHTDNFGMILNISESANTVTQSNRKKEATIATHEEILQSYGDVNGNKLSWSQHDSDLGNGEKALNSNEVNGLGQGEFVVTLRSKNKD